MNHGKMVAPKQHVPQRKFVVTIPLDEYRKLTADSIRIGIIVRYIVEENGDYGFFNPIRRILGMESVQKDK